MHDGSANRACACPFQGTNGPSDVYDRSKEKVLTDGMFVWEACRFQDKCKEDERRKKQLEARQHKRT